MGEIERCQLRTAQKQGALIGKRVTGPSPERGIVNEAADREVNPDQEEEDQD